MIAALIELFASTGKTAAEEGRDIILAMLVVGLIFLGVALLGDFLRYVTHKRD